MKDRIMYALVNKYNQLCWEGNHPLIYDNYDDAECDMLSLNQEKHYGVPFSVTTIKVQEVKKKK